MNESKTIKEVTIDANKSLNELLEDESATSIGKNFWSMLLLFLCVPVVFGNVLVILSVVKERNLQNITNYFIVSLAVADLCVAGVAMPFYTYTLVGCKNIREFFSKCIDRFSTIYSILTSKFDLILGSLLLFGVLIGYY